MLRRCSLCERDSIIGHGRRRKQAHDEHHDWIGIRRGVCLGCGKTFTLLPTLSLPYTHYSLLARAQALRRHFTEHWSWEEAMPTLKDPDRVPDPSTLRRWSAGLDRSQPAASFRRQTFARVAHWLRRGTRFVAFSTLCVYPFSPVNGSGATPDDTPPTPLGEYANSCVARELVFQDFSEKTASPGRLARLNYPIDCRYGVLHDIALWMRTGAPIDVRTGVANCIWQGDAIAYILRCLSHGTVPARPINTGLTEPASVRQVARRFGELFGKQPVFSGTEQLTAWHNDCSEAPRLLARR